MDSRESTAPPPQLQRQPAPPPPPAGIMVGPSNSYAPNLPSNNNTSPMISPNSTANTMMQNPRFPFNSMVTSTSKSFDTLNPQYGNGSQSAGLKPCGFNIEPARKKRGRPRKYSPDGNIALGLAPTPVSSVSLMPHGDSGVATPSTDATAKRSRGRPPGSGKKQLDALGSFGVGFTPHVILVKPAEDIASKILAFSQQGPRTVCILSANGAVCSVTLRQTAVSGGAVTHEGRFEIISLSGSFTPSENNGNQSRIGGLIVSLAGSDGRVLGGGVAGRLVAATTVQVILGSFIVDGKKSKPGPSSAPLPNMLNFGPPMVAVSPPSRGASSESSEENSSSPLNRGASGFYGNATQPIHGMPMYSNMGWGNSAVKMLPN